MSHYAEKRIDDVWYFQVTPGGAWARKKRQEERQPVDTMLAYIQDQLGLKSPKDAMFTIGMEFSQVSRIRNSKGRQFTSNHVLNIYDVMIDYGKPMTIEAIRALMGLQHGQPNNKFSKG